jgi:protein-S-isoprenylcysteine O-methyltransferase Ste14
MNVSRGFVYLVYCGATMALLVVAALYGVAFVGNVLVPKTIDSGAAGPWPLAMLVDVLLFLVFALQHSVMARPSFKRRWTRIVPAPIERSTYVLITSLLLLALCWLWRPIPIDVWSVQTPALRSAITTLFWAGWIVTGLAAAATNQAEMIGLRQVLDANRGKPAGDLTLTTSGLYRIVRHPIYVGAIVAFWATPDMTVGHLVFSVLATVYTVLGAMLEERDLVRIFGDAYRDYQERVRMLLPIPK